MKRQETENKVTVIGGGLAGSEAAYQLAKRGIPVILYEMRPQRMTEAHVTSNFAELVCSNSFGSNSEGAASWLLKQEVEKMGSFILSLAKKHSVPAGQSLAIDREAFSEEVTQTLEQLPLIEIRREELNEIPEKGVVVMATGPLTTANLSQSLQSIIGGNSLYFYDAISPIVSLDSLDLNEMFYASRYGKGEADFLNIPLEKEAYFEFVDDLLQAEKVVAHEFEKEKYFESCMPIEVIASRGPLTLAFGPMKPVGLENPKTGKRAFAVVQLRAENKYKTAYNLVGFQTKMKYPEQLRIFRKLPGFSQAEFLRLGSLHRNTYLDSPRVLTSTLQLKARDSLFVAGQLTGTEGYLESAATGLLAGINAAAYFSKEELVKLPAATMLGALLEAITDETKENFQPINANFGVLPPLEEKPPKGKFDKKTKGMLFTQRSQKVLSAEINAGRL